MTFYLIFTFLSACVLLLSTYWVGWSLSHPANLGVLLISVGSAFIFLLMTLSGLYAINRRLYGKKKVTPENRFEFYIREDGVNFLVGKTVKLLGETFVLKSDMVHFIPISKVKLIHIWTEGQLKIFAVKEFIRLYKIRGSNGNS